MSQRNILIIVVVVVILAILGWSRGWFGGAPAPVAPTTAPAPATTPAPAQGTTSP